MSVLPAGAVGGVVAEFGNLRPETTISRDVVVIVCGLFCDKDQHTLSRYYPLLGVVVNPVVISHPNVLRVNSGRCGVS